MAAETTTTKTTTAETVTGAADKKDEESKVTKPTHKIGGICACGGIQYTPLRGDEHVLQVCIRGCALSPASASRGKAVLQAPTKHKNTVKKHTPPVSIDAVENPVEA